MGRKLENKNATPTEIELYRYAGFYLIESSEKSLTYAPIHTDNISIDFPALIENVEDKMIEMDKAIILDKMSDSVLFKGNEHWYDADILAMILRRTEELQFKKDIFDGVFRSCNDNSSFEQRNNLSVLQLFVNEVISTAFKHKEQNELCFDLMRWSKEEPYWCVFACEHGTGGVSGVKGVVSIGGHYCIGKDGCIHDILDTLTQSGWNVEIHTEYFL